MNRTIGKKRVERILWITLITGISFLLLMGIFSLSFPLPDNIPYSTIVTDDQGEVIHASLSADQQWRIAVTPDDITPLLKRTILSKEDRYFYYHPGVNPFALLKSLEGNIIHGKIRSGASTITMQVARALEPGGRTYLHKFREIFRALQLEWKYPKDQILQLYLNLVPYGGNIQGIRAASLFYFKKNPDHLSLAEITTLAIIPNRPTSLVIGRYNDRIVKERNRWLKRFEAEKVFTGKQIADALKEPLTAARQPAPQEIPQLAYRLRRQGVNRIGTFIHRNTQLKLEKLVADYIRDQQRLQISNAAVVVIDNHTHKVIAYVGSADFHDSSVSGQVNGAAAIRQPGSTLKPLLYGLCIDQGLLTPRQVIHDVAVNFQGYAPENFDRRFNGTVTMEYALEHSLNIPAVRSLNQLGTDVFIRRLAACDFKQIKKDQAKLGLSMVLGGCGATLEELTGMYSMLAGKGIYYRPRYRDDDSGSRPVRILSEAADFMISQTLSRVNRPDFPLNWQSTVHLPKIAWKTGTSYGRRDAWSVGYNAHFTVGVWCGNFSARGVAGLSGANTATPLLFQIFNSIDYDSDEPWFSAPERLETRMVCPESGLPPGPWCTGVVTADYIPGISPVTACGHLKEVLLSADGRWSYCRSCCPPAGYQKKLFPVIAPDMERYYEDNRLAYVKIPPHNPACEKIFRENGPSITSPQAGSEYLISRKNPEPLQLRCNTGNDVSRIFWYINNRFYRASDAHAKPFFIPEEGPVKISCTDDKGRNRDIWIRVKYVDG